MPLGISPSPSLLLPNTGHVLIITFPLLPPGSFLGLLFQHFTHALICIHPRVSFHPTRFLSFFIFFFLPFSSCLLCSFSPLTFTSAPPASPTRLFQSLSPLNLLSSSCSSPHAFYVFQSQNICCWVCRWESGRLTQVDISLEEETLTGIREVIYKQVIKKMILHLYLPAFPPLQQETRCRSGEMVYLCWESDQCVCAGV